MQELKHQLSIRELTTGWPCSWRYVNRYSTSRCVRPENVAEHTAFVCLYAAAVVKWVVFNNREGGWDPQRLMATVMLKAAVHDLEECRTGDIHRPFKYSDPQLKGNLDRAAGLASEQILARLFPGPELTLRAEFHNLWREAKEGGEAGRIVRFADYLSVVSFVAQEGKDAPQRLCLDTMRAALEEFVSKSEYDFIRPLVDEAAALTEEVLNAGG